MKWMLRRFRGGRSSRKAAKRARTKLGVLEMLERRDLLTAMYWDPNGSAAGVGGSGAWDTSSALWTTDPAGLTGHVVWNNSAGDEAIFAGSAGTVTLSAGITAGGLTASTDGYQLQNGSLALSGALDVSAATTLSIASPLVGSGSLRIDRRISSTFGAGSGRLEKDLGCGLFP